MKYGGNESPLFEIKRPRGIVLYRFFAVSVFLCICLIWTYRASHVPKFGEEGRWVWIGMFAAELWFGFYWLLTQSFRWNPVFRQTFKDRLIQRHKDKLPNVDIFVCTADPDIEPPMLVINTVLSVMAYDYPPEKLAVYLSDDGGSDLTFYALLEASKFGKHWIPFCKKFNVEPRSPAAYFASSCHDHDDMDKNTKLVVKKLYEEMKNRIETASELGRISNEIRSQHEGFSQWDSYSSRRDHDSILQILIDGKNPNAIDIERNVLPTLVYMAREKRPQYNHNFKAGAMNALLRVSSKISNAPIILNVDCDMYSNDSQSIQDALCIFLDEENGQQIAFVQFGQNYENVTENDIYGGSLRVIREVEFYGLDGYGGPLYVGTGCFHRRDTLLGIFFNKEDTIVLRVEENNEREGSNTLNVLQETAKGLANCSYEQNTQWGKEIGLQYGCPVEDVITGLSIQCRGWKSAYLNPTRKAFLGLAAITLPQTLVQHKRWSEGDFQILLSRFSPAWYAKGKISLGMQLGYSCYCLWAINSLPVLFYAIVPSLYLLKGISLFPEVSSSWFVPFTYLVFSSFASSLVEFIFSGGTIRGWWNEQRIWLYKRTTSYIFAFIDVISRKLGFSEMTFVITNKVSDQDVFDRYKKDIMEFGDSSPMFIILATIALANMFCLLGSVIKKVVADEGSVEKMFLQLLLCVFLVVINFPLYQALFFRRDKGQMPVSVTIKSTTLAISLCSCFTLFY